MKYNDVPALSKLEKIFEEFKTQNINTLYLSDFKERLTPKEAFSLVTPYISFEFSKEHRAIKLLRDGDTPLVFVAPERYKQGCYFERYLGYNDPGNFEICTSIRNESVTRSIQYMSNYLSDSLYYDRQNFKRIAYNTYGLRIAEIPCSGLELEEYYLKENGINLVFKFLFSLYGSSKLKSIFNYYVLSKNTRMEPLNFEFFLLERNDYQIEDFKNTPLLHHISIDNAWSMKKTKASLKNMGLSKSAWKLMSDVGIRSSFDYATSSNRVLVNLFNFYSLIGMNSFNSKKISFFSSFANEITSDYSAVDKDYVENHLSKIIIPFVTKASAWFDSKHGKISYYDVVESWPVDADGVQFLRRTATKETRQVSKPCRRIYINALFNWYVKYYATLSREVLNSDFSGMYLAFSKEKAELANYISNPGYEWDSLLDSFELEIEEESYAVTPLTNSYELIKESRKMNHCVGNGTYDVKCIRHDDASRIFNIKGPESATIQITKSGRFSWIPSQVLTTNNKNPKLDLTHRASTIIASMYSIEHAKKNNHQPYKRVDVRSIHIGSSKGPLSGKYLKYSEYLSAMKENEKLQS